MKINKYNLVSYIFVFSFQLFISIAVGVAIGRAGLGWVGPTMGRAKIGPVFSGQNFNSPARPKNRAGRAK